MADNVPESAPPISIHTSSPTITPSEDAIVSPMEDNVPKHRILIKYLDQKAPPQERLVFKQKEIMQEISDTMTIAELKKAFEDKLKPKPGFNAERIFIYQGRILKRDMKLGDLKLNDKSFLICVLKRLNPIEEKKVEEEEDAPVPAPGPRVIQAQQYNEEVITNLIGLGNFPRDVVIACLQAAYGNADRAAEYLFGGIPERAARPRLPGFTTRVISGSGSASASSTSSPPPDAPHPWNEFAVNDIIDAQDQSEHWYEATIREVREDSVLVHYNGWSTRWDEWLPRDSVRLGPRGSHSRDPATPSTSSTEPTTTSSSSSTPAAVSLPSRRAMLTATRTRSSSRSSSRSTSSSTATSTTTTTTTSATTATASTPSSSSSSTSEPIVFPNPWEQFSNPPLTSAQAPASSTPPPSASPSTYQPRDAVQRPAADLNQQIQARVQERLTELEDQIRTQMRQAFFEVLEQKLASEPPDYDWVIKLYVEIRERIGSLTPNRQDFQAELKEQMDEELFAQMLRSNAYDATQLQKLVHFVFGRIEFLEAPARNQSTQALLAALDAEMQKPGCKFSTFVPLFIRHAHTKLDEIEQDIRRIHSIVRGRNDAT